MSQLSGVALFCIIEFTVKYTKSWQLELKDILVLFGVLNNWANDYKNLPLGCSDSFFEQFEENAHGGASAIGQFVSSDSKGGGSFGGVGGGGHGGGYGQVY